MQSLNPLRVTLHAPPGPYALGDAIAATITLHAHRNVRIRHAALNLVVEARRTVAKPSRTMDMGGRGTLQGGNAFVTTDYIPMAQVTNVETSEEVAYGVRFLGPATILADIESRHSPTLKLGPAAPEIVSAAKELQRDANSSIEFRRWWIEARVDVAWGRDESARKQVEVDVPSFLAEEPPQRR